MRVYSKKRAMISELSELDAALLKSYIYLLKMLSIKCKHRYLHVHVYLNIQHTRVSLYYKL